GLPLRRPLQQSRRGVAETGQERSGFERPRHRAPANPNFADAYQNRGVVKNVLKLFPEALADFNQALKLNPGKNNGAIYVGRGISKLFLGDNAGACEDWHTASDLAAANAATLIAEYCKK